MSYFRCISYKYHIVGFFSSKMAFKTILDATCNQFFFLIIAIIHLIYVPYLDFLFAHIFNVSLSSFLSDLRVNLVFNSIFYTVFAFVCFIFYF